MDVLGDDAFRSAAEAPPPMPESISFVRALLLVQAVIWSGWASLLGVWTVIYLAQVVKGSGAPGVYVLGVTASLALLTASLAALKSRLRKRLAAGLRRSRLQVVGLEVAMACLGVVMVIDGFTADADSDGLPADTAIMAGSVGAVLSAVAALVLFTGAARRHLDTLPLSRAGSGPKPDDSDGRAPFRDARRTSSGVARPAIS